MKNKPKILVVDKDKNILSAFENYLRKKNYSMTGANNVITGLNKIRQRNFHLLITDVREDSGFGKSFISNAKQVRDNLRIIAITSYPDKINESDLKTYGVDYLFIKPLELGKLDKAIESCLSRQKRNSTTEKTLTINGE